MAIFVTPEIPFKAFDDYNPGHGLDSFAETVADLRTTYHATAVRRIQTPRGFHFQVVGPRRHIRKLARLYDVDI
jgi:hypothetical protein